MKGIDIFCASPASTAICVSMDQRSMVCNGGSPAIDCHNPHVRDERRSSRSLTPPPCSSSLQLPKSYPHKGRKSSASSASATKPATVTDKSKKSSAKSSDRHHHHHHHHHHLNCSRKSSAKPSDHHHHHRLTSPPGSSRYLLSDTPFFDVFTDFNPSSSSVQQVPVEPSITRSSNPDESPVLKPSSSSRSHDKVVVLRVSLHCRGCEGKVRKHISRMQGVTSFSIDFAAKRVTVVGDVTPLGVLASVSRVKNAQLWPSPTSPVPTLVSTY